MFPPANSTSCWRARTPTFPCSDLPREPIELAEYAAGLNVARTVLDGGTLQLGIGSLGDAVTQALILRHRSNPEFLRVVARLDPADRAPPGLRESAPFDIGLHGVSEMLVEGFLDAARCRHSQARGRRHGAGRQRSSSARARSIAALREMPQAELAKLRMTSVSFVNELYGDDEPAKRRARVKARFINNAMMATLLGAVISDGTGGRPRRERRRRPI